MLALNLVLSAWMCVLWFAACEFMRVNAAAVSAVKVLNDGKKYKTGNITAFPGVNWRSSGLLEQGGCTYSVHKISTCFTYTLSSNKSANLDPYNDQQIYFITPVVTTPTSSKTVTYTYKWKSYVESTVQASDYYALTVVHSEGLENRYLDGYSYAGFYSLGAAKGKTGMYYGTNETAWGVSTSWAGYRGRPTSHVMKLALAKGECNGYEYTVTDTNTGATLVHNKATGVFCAIDDVSLTIGIFRYPGKGMSTYTAHWGDYSFSKS